MKTLTLLSAFGLIAGPSLALATPTCGGVTVEGLGELAAAVGGKTVCVGSPGNWENQEYHNGGIIDEYKKGPGDPVDPSVVGYGSYTIGTSSQHDTIQYTYGGSPFQVYMVGISGSSIFYCDDIPNDDNGAGTVKVTGQLKSGSGGCP